MKIPLSNGGYAIVDKDDYAYISRWKWKRHMNGYAVRGFRNQGIRMHRLINKTPEGMITDHINGDKLDNRRVNLRSCTYSQNNAAGPIRSDNTSGYKGVSWQKNRNRWRVQLTKDGKNTYIGMFKSLEEAGKAYNDAAKRLHGEFARLNNIIAIKEKI